MTVDGTVHKVYHKAFKEKYVKLATKTSNKCMFDGAITPVGDASKQSKPTNSYIIPCSSTAIQIMPLLGVGSLGRDVAPLVLSRQGRKTC